MKLLIADDEPLVQAGIKSMINWEEYGVHIIGTAATGALAWEMIKKHKPDIVITDIMMPVMSGLELARKCYEEKMPLPVFIILTSYEEFQFVKEALTYQVIDYLVKLELTPESLIKTLKRAINKVNEQQVPKQISETSYHDVFVLREQFFTRLLLNLFESEHQFVSQAQNLNISFEYAAYIVCYMEIDRRENSMAKLPKLNINELSADHKDNMSAQKQLMLFTSCHQMAGELISKYVPCHVLSLDMKHFGIIFFLDDKNMADYHKVIKNAIEQVSSMLFNYYSVEVCASIGSVVNAPMQISSSYQDAKQIFSRLNDSQKLLFFDDVPISESLKNVFNMSLLKEDIRKAYAEFDEKALYDIFTSIIELFERKPEYYVQALDAAGNVLYMSLSLLSDGEQIVSKIFEERNNGYRSLYELTSVELIMEWLANLRDGLCDCFAAHNKDYKNHIVIEVKKYIREHIKEKLSLNKVAEVFGISPNYLSVLFSKYNDVGFTDYVNKSKVDAAKEMMSSGDYKVYEISDILGFESAFYFSRVFKKVTGYAPRDYINKAAK